MRIKNYAVFNKKTGDKMSRTFFAMYGESGYKKALNFKRSMIHLYKVAPEYFTKKQLIVKSV